MSIIDEVMNEYIKIAGKIKVIITEYKRSTKTNQKKIKQIAKTHDGKFIDWWEKDYGIESEWNFSNGADANSFITKVKRLKNVDADIER